LGEIIISNKIKDVSQSKLIFEHFFVVEFYHLNFKFH